VKLTPQINPLTPRLNPRCPAVLRLKPNAFSHLKPIRISNTSSIEQAGLTVIGLDGILGTQSTRAAETRGASPRSRLSEPEAVIWSGFVAVLALSLFILTLSLLVAPAPSAVPSVGSAETTQVLFSHW
jgi:hypothetical protein